MNHFLATDKLTEMDNLLAQPIICPDNEIKKLTKIEVDKFAHFPFFFPVLVKRDSIASFCREKPRERLCTRKTKRPCKIYAFMRQLNIKRKYVQISSASKRDT